MNTSFKTLLTSLSSEGIFTITINRPDKLNALNAEVITDLGEAIDAVYREGKIKGAIITGSGEKAFVAGADISEFLQLDAEQGRALALRGQELVFSRIETCSKPVIAAINGFALGGGCELAMACHLRVASTNAKFGQPEVNLGLIPGYGGTQRLVQLIGRGRAMELLLTGNMLGAQEAWQYGLVNTLVEPVELLSTAQKLMNTILSKAPLAVQNIISLVNTASYDHEHGLEQEVNAFGRLFSTHDVKEGATAFLEKRKPVFKGE